MNTERKKSGRKSVNSNPNYTSSSNAEYIYITSTKGRKYHYFVNENGDIINCDDEDDNTKIVKDSIDVKAEE